MEVFSNSSIYWCDGKAEFTHFYCTLAVNSDHSCQAPKKLTGKVSIQWLCVQYKYLIKLSKAVVFSSGEHRRHFLRMLISKRFQFPLTSIICRKNTMEVNGIEIYLVANILHNIIFHVSQKKLKSYRDGTMWRWLNNNRIFIFVWTISLV